MKSPTVATLKKLFALSANLCAFPKCTNRLIDPSSGTLTAEVCHIRGRKTGHGSQRYDPRQSEDERHGIDNLIALCPAHHTVIDDDADSYTVERLRNIKAAHEDKCRGTSVDSGTLAETFAVAIRNNIVNGGSIIYAHSQSGGQVANTINNYGDPSRHGPPKFERELSARNLVTTTSPSFGDTKYAERMAFPDQNGRFARLRTIGLFFALTDPPLVRQNDRDAYFQWMTCNQRRYDPITDSLFIPSVESELRLRAYVWHNGEKLRFNPRDAYYDKYLAMELDHGYIEYGFFPGSIIAPDGGHVYYAKILAGFVAFLRFLRDFSDKFDHDASCISFGLAMRGTTETQLKWMTKRVMDHYQNTSSPATDGFRWVREAAPGADWDVHEVARAAALDLLDHWSYSGPAWAGQPEFTDGKYTGDYFRSDFYGQW